MRELSQTEVDQLGDRLRMQLTVDDLMLLDMHRRNYRAEYDLVVSRIRELLNIEVSGRPAKSTSAIVDKLRRGTMRLSQMQDIAGCRVVIEDTKKQEDSVGHLCHIFSPVVFDRRRTPSYGYRAVHLITRANNRPIEIQIRTDLQHLWAELSEKFSDVYDPNIKYGGGNQTIRKPLDTVSPLIARIEALEGNIANIDELNSIKLELKQSLLQTILALGTQR